jgi:hypothetical protein
VAFRFASPLSPIVAIAVNAFDPSPKQLHFGLFKPQSTGEDKDDIILGSLLSDRMDGGSGNDMLFGDRGHDTLNGGFGADVLVGGRGNDTYIIDNIHDIIMEKNNDGIDMVLTTVTYHMALGLENLVMQGNAPLSAYGNELNNQVIGNSADNLIEGGRGNDLLIGGLGNDTYLFHLGDGHDIVQDKDLASISKDCIKWVGEKHTLADMSWIKQGNSLCIQTDDSQDSVVIKDWFLGVVNQIEIFWVNDAQVLSSEINALDWAAHSNYYML